MKIHNLILSVALTILLAIFCAAPNQTILASVDYQAVSTFDSKKIVKSLPKEVYNIWAKRKGEGDNSMNLTTLSLLKEILRKDARDYMLHDLPIDISINVISETIDLSRIIIAGDVASVIKKIEKDSVNFAVSYLNDYFNKGKAKVGYGAIDVNYTTSYGNTNTIIQYIVLLKEIDDNKSEVVMRIYSPKAIIPPDSYKGYGMIEGFSNELSSGQSISPFITEIKGVLKKSSLGEYSWVGSPNIDLVFSENVPDFGLRPPSLVEKYIIAPVQEKVKEIGGIFSFLGGNTEFVEVLTSGREDKEAIEKELVSMTEEKSIASASCSRNNLGSPLHNIVINEIAWMGGINSANDEWIELKNISSRDIDMKGWSLVDKENQIDITFDSLLVKSGAFVLLERTSDNAVSFINADLIYKGTLGNTNEELYLFNSNCGLEDYVAANSSWPAGDSSQRRTMERISNFDWQTYSGEPYNNILGTPKKDNSVKKVEQEVKTEKKIEIREVEIKEEPKEEKKEEVKEELKEEPKEEKKEEVAISYCSQVGTPSYSGVIINEVAWMGTTVGATKEWVELKNVSTTSINMNGWQLLDKDNQIKIIFNESDILMPGQLYLLERTDDDSVPHIVADKIYSGNLSNTNESLRLFNSSCQLIDEVVANPNWPAGASTERKTMERGNDLSWHNSINVNGSPKAENSQLVTNSNASNNQSTTTVIYVSSPSTPQEVINYCSKIGAPNYAGLIINEVAWMGTTAGSTKEWIELKNISDNEIILDGWQLLSNNNKIKIVFNEDDAIMPQQYYLLERTSDDSVPDIVADKIYTGALNNSNDLLMLFNNNCQLIDEVVASPDWPAGASTERKTMERISDLSWHTSINVNGSPRAENTIPLEDDLLGEEEETNENEELEEEDGEGAGESEDDGEEEEDGEGQGGNTVVENSSLVISEIQINGENSLEYVELYNQGEEEIDLCSEEDECYYLSYYSPTFLDGFPKYDWHGPYHNWQLEGVIAPGEYYLIVIYGNIEGSMVVKNENGNPYSSAIINNFNGSFSLFNSNPVINNEELLEEEKVEMAKSFKIDVVAWGDNSLPVREGEVTFISTQGMSTGRKWLDGKYVDTDNNFNDFQLQKPSPGEYCKQSPEKIKDIQVESFKNSVTLYWDTPLDVDSSSEEISYEVYFSIDDANFKLLEGLEIISEEDINSATIQNLYYDRDHYFSIKAIDIDDNESDISETVSCKTETSNHTKPLLYGNNQKNNIFDIPYLSGEIPAESLSLLMEYDYYSSQLNSNSLIGDGEILYTSISLSGSRKIFATKDEVVLWSYNCQDHCYLIFLGKDGTIYFNDSNSVGALSPWGELRWRETFGYILLDSFVVDSQEKIYFITSDNKVYGIEDHFNSANIQNIYNLNDYARNLMVVDSDDNIYFASKDTIFKAAFYQGKISEKRIEVDYHEDYEGERDKVSSISGINIVSGNRILINAQDHYYDEEGGSHRVAMLLSSDMNEIIWSKNDYSVPLAIGDNQYYIWQGRAPAGSWVPIFYLNGIDLSNGEILWGKKHVAPIGINVDQINYLIVDKNDNIYFIQGSRLTGYDTNNITSEDPKDDEILRINLGETGSYFSVGRDKIFFNFYKRIKSVQY
ncbi:MAG: lamin tail domain-containing protein [Candidatus Pacebacteria bacterium]|nr:lamin tail domain-containing protein [Candidatus Paceibacterota bacterium]MDD4737808.1 lamin tail domain-containing protein [Candidatus Paceibacterota bacterium]